MEIIQTTDATTADQDIKTSIDEPIPTIIHERELALLDGLVPFKNVRRQLIPKRADKDPVMEEQLYYCRDARIQEQDQGLGTTAGQENPRVPNQAIFAPTIARTTSTTDTKDVEADLNQLTEEDEIKILTEALPFYYPKVRGFRYGYQFDPEEAPEVKEDHHDDGHNHDQDDGEKEKDGQGKQGQGGAEKPSTPAPAPAPKKKHALKNRIISQRTGWLSLDLYLNGDEGEFTDKIVSDSFQGDLFVLLLVFYAGATQITFIYVTLFPLRYSNTRSRNCSRNCTNGATTPQKGSQRAESNTTS